MYNAGTLMTLKEKVRIFACLNYDPGRKHLPENLRAQPALQMGLGTSSCFLVQKVRNKFEIILSWMCHTKENAINKC